MGQISPVLRKTELGYGHWCPGCEKMHVIYTTGNGPLWSFDGNATAPTFNPSVKITWGRGDKPPRICHYFLHAGQIQFCGDSTHTLRGQTVPLPQLPPEHAD